MPADVGIRRLEPWNISGWGYGLRVLSFVFLRTNCASAQNPPSEMGRMRPLANLGGTEENRPRSGEQSTMPFTSERIEGKTQLHERLDRNERIDRKTQLLEQLDPEREFELEGTFTNHVADAIRASSPRGELQQEIDKATEAYEDALDGVLNEILDEHLGEDRED